MSAVREFVNDNIAQFHNGRLRKLENLKLDELLRRKNPYLFRAKNLLKSSEVIESFLEASLSSSEEERFGQFLEALAIFVSEQTCSGQKSSTPGVDLEFSNNDVRYLVSIKSGVNWGNNSQHERLAANLNSAVSRIRQNDRNAHIQTVLGCCYGRSKTVNQTKHGYMKIVGQSFWHFLSGDENLYTEIVDPIGYMAEQRNEDFAGKKSALVNRLSIDFTQRFCDQEGYIDWPRLVEFNSGNMR